MFIPGVCLCDEVLSVGDGEGDEAGIFPDASLISCFSCFFFTARFLYTEAFPFGASLALFMPPVSCPSCCENTVWPIENEKNAIDKTRYL